MISIDVFGMNLEVGSYSYCMP